MLKDTVTFRPHQAKILPTAVESDAYGLFHDMGRGKTLTAIAATFEKYEQGKINAHLVIPLTTIKSTWVMEYAKFSEDDSYDVFVMESGKTQQAKQWISEPSTKLKVFIVGVESLSQGVAFELAYMFVKEQKTHITIDESTSIKNATSLRTKKLFKLAKSSVSRFILTGTPNPNGLEDLYAQFYFLDPLIIGLKSYFAFRSRYCLMGGFEGRKVIGYQNEDILWGLLRPHCDVVKVDETEMPERQWLQVQVPVTPEQKRIIKDLEGSFESEMGDKILSTSTILERLTRFQQVLGGSFPYINEDDVESGRYSVDNLAKIPKLDALVEQIGLLPANAKVIIWARFIPEIHRIVEALEKANLGTVVQFHGLVSSTDRDKATEDFQNGKARFMITNKSGARGQTWTSAAYSIFYSNDYSYEVREQAERRNWGRDASTHDVVYIDLVAESKYDKATILAIKTKKNVADLIKEELMK